MHSRALGHLLAIFTVFVWGITFVSSKVLLEEFTPIEILFDRFLLGFIALSLCVRSWGLFPTARLNLYAALAAFFGITFYFLLENSALEYAPSANVSLIVSVAPLFVGLCDRATGYVKSLPWNFFLGFVIAFSGIAALSANSIKLELNPLGDLLALGAGFVWCLYNLFVRKIYKAGYSPLRATYVIFMWNLVLALPFMAVLGYRPKLDMVLEPRYLLNFLFLGLVASSACFFTWNKALELIGGVSTNVYLYFQSVVTAVFAVLLIDEQITRWTIIGMVLVTAGLMLSQGFSLRRLRGSRKEARGA
jgi:drug/metabolite transporter (DMT)-like permease